MIDEARAGANDFEWRYRLLMPDNSIKYLHALAHASRDQDGQLEYIAAVQDVTDRRLSEEALGKLQSELAHMARVTSLGALTRRSRMKSTSRYQVSSPTRARVCGCWTPILQISTARAKPRGARFAMATAHLM